MQPIIFIVVNKAEEARIIAPNPKAEIVAITTMAMKLPKMLATDILTPYLIVFLIVKTTAGPGMATIVTANIT